MLTGYIPNTITLLNLLSGCLAIIFSFNQGVRIGALMGYQWVFVFIAAAAVFDFWDGAAARLLHKKSPLGKELDSLSDLVSFGLAPALLLYNIMQDIDHRFSWIPFLVLFIPMMGALRLAIFNIDDSQATSFRGLPIPANAIFWIGFAGWIHSYKCYPSDWVIITLVILISLAMVSRIPMFSLKFKDFSIRNNLRRYVILLAAVVFLAIYGIAGLAWTIILYMLISILSRRRTEME